MHVLADQPVAGDRVGEGGRLRAGTPAMADEAGAVTALRERHRGGLPAPGQRARFEGAGEEIHQAEPQRCGSLRRRPGRDDVLGETLCQGFGHAQGFWHAQYITMPPSATTVAPCR